MRHAAALAAALALAACSDDAGNFSQEPGFAAWYAANPPAEAVPDAAGQALLERYRPHVFLPAGDPGPIDFYRDYIAHGSLRDGSGRLISAEVTAEILNAHKHDPGVVFAHRPGGDPPQPAIYGRIDRGELALPGCAAPLPVTFLSWHLVFARSGLPAALPAWQAAVLGVLGDLDDWHQLDHYTALTLALAPARFRHSPLPSSTTTTCAATFCRRRPAPAGCCCRRTAGSRSTSRCARTSSTRTSPAAPYGARSRS